MDLKPYYAAAEAATAEVKLIARKIDALFTAGEQKEALALRPAFDEAKTKATNANSLYLSMRDAEDISVLPLFGPAKPGARTMGRRKFDALDAGKKMTYIQAGGQIDFP